MDILAEYYYIVIPLILFALFLLFKKPGATKRPPVNRGAVVGSVRGGYNAEFEANRAIVERMLKKLPIVLAETGKTYSTEDKINIAKGLLGMVHAAKLKLSVLDDNKMFRLMTLAVIEVLEKEGLIG